MREVNVAEITAAVKTMCINANINLNADISGALQKAYETEEAGTGKEILGQLIKNSEIAREQRMPICQDTGMVVVFIKLGQDVHLTGGDLTAAVNEGIRQGYREGYLRCSVVKSPLDRVNTGDNTPGIIHVEIVPGKTIQIDLAPKGFGSENASRVHMLKPSDGVEGVKKAVIKTVDEAGPNACPPIVVGVGIGGSFELCAMMAKKALLRPVGSHSDDPSIRDLETELLDEINKLGIGPAGLGGRTTALTVNIETYPTHIAGLPVAVNINCHVTRHASVTI